MTDIDRTKLAPTDAQIKPAVLCELAMAYPERYERWFDSPFGKRADRIEQQIVEHTSCLASAGSVLCSTCVVAPATSLTMMCAPKPHTRIAMPRDPQP